MAEMASAPQSPVMLGKDSFLIALEAQVTLAERYPNHPRSPFALAYTDIDKFKSVNDELGHDVGDLVLDQLQTNFLDVAARGLQILIQNEQGHVPIIAATQWIARATVEPLPEEESTRGGLVVPARIGGDEFATIIKGGVKEVEAFSRSLRRGFDTVLDSMPELRRLNVGLAIGYAIFEPGKSMTATDLLKAADKAMQENKINRFADHLRTKTPEQIDHLRECIRHAILAGIPLRDLPKAALALLRLDEEAGGLFVGIS